MPGSSIRGPALQSEARPSHRRPSPPLRGPAAQPRGPGRGGTPSGPEMAQKCTFSPKTPRNPAENRSPQNPLYSSCQEHDISAPKCEKCDFYEILIKSAEFHVFDLPKPIISLRKRTRFKNGPFLSNFYVKTMKVMKYEK